MKGLNLLMSKTWLTNNLLSFLSIYLTPLIISIIFVLSLMPIYPVLADDISNSSETVPNIWQCIGCPPGQVGTRMSLEEQQANLNDLWGKEVLRQGKFPQEVKDSQEAIAQTNQNLTEKIYLVAEGGQIPISVASRDAQRDPRIAITWRSGNLLSTFLSGNPGAETGFLQVIAWDSQKNKFNYYELNRDKNWSWAGNSSHARQPQFVGKGCFDCHHNGSVIMKELKVPWNNWTSQVATIDLSFLPKMVAQDPNLSKLVGAEQLEQDIRGGVSQYYMKWLDRHVSSDLKTITEIPELLRHLTTTTSVNFESNNPGPTNTPVVPPKNFFLFDDAWAQVAVDGSGGAGYNFPTTIGFDTNKFKQIIGVKGFALRQCDRVPDTNQCQPNTVDYEQKGTTFNPFFVPVPSNEDTFVIQNLMKFRVDRGSQRKYVQFITDKFAAAILMVDFQNPVFSLVRSSLQTYADKLDVATIDDQGVSNIPSLFVAQIQEAVKNQSPCSTQNLDGCSAEQQFLNTWNLPDATWKDTVNQRIQAYLNAVGNQITNGAGLSDYVDLIISREQQFSSINPINNLFESSLLLPQSNLPVSTPVLQTQADGKVKSHQSISLPTKVSRFSHQLLPRQPKQFKRVQSDGNSQTIQHPSTD